MSITRIIAVDPAPRKPEDDLLIYQVPEKSRACEVLLALLESAGYTYVVINSEKKHEPSSSLSA